MEYNYPSHQSLYIAELAQGHLFFWPAYVDELLLSCRNKEEKKAQNQKQKVYQGRLLSSQSCRLPELKGQPHYFC